MKLLVNHVSQHVFLNQQVHYMSNGMIHVQRSVRKIACKQVLIGWMLIFWYKVQRQQIHRTVELFSTSQNPGSSMYVTVYPSWNLHHLPMSVSIDTWITSFYYWESYEMKNVIITLIWTKNLYGPKLTPNKDKAVVYKTYILAHQGSNRCTVFPLALWVKLRSHEQCFFSKVGLL